MAKICPRCQSKLRVLPDTSLFCWKCELHRKPTDRVLLRPDTQYWVVKRNLNRVPPGSEVEVVGCNSQLVGTFGTFDDRTGDFAIRSKTGFVVATSRDIEDLAILIVENEWYVQGPEQLLKILDILAS